MQSRALKKQMHNNLAKNKEFKDICSRGLYLTVVETYLPEALEVIFSLFPLNDLFLKPGSDT